MPNTYTWYKKSSSLSSPDTIHQILAYGTLADIKNLKKKAGEQKIKKIFLAHPKKIYTPSQLNFIKNFLLQLNTNLDEKKYLKTTPRSTG